MQPIPPARFIRFLHEELALPKDSITIAQRLWEQNPGSLPMILWQYGLVSLQQLDQIFDWMDNSPSANLL
ncbi:DUF2949 domain-containing protein [Spirulina subsalsa FACHB-351]|uniref:DUF2949 domain-containing protein n=1 Tax=Spirulina subsalsa FACHB-351 TaxID=234711 RepID=A0ABT3L9I0_9CYAN|nr:DUF2949 domain-containing protein [Spirulina subsalsa]MCW6038168.1 DUF2949 domain-containing protein [Spirulina subsalsa FACHB-351]